MTGPDRLTWLNSLTTQDVRDLAPGASVELMILNPQGRIEHVAAAVDDGERTWLITESREGLAAHLDRMRFMLRVEVEDATAEWAAIGEPLASPAADGEPVTWVDPWPGVSPGGTSYGPETPDHPGASRPWRLVLVARDRLEAEARARIDAGWSPAGTWAAEALRIAARRPRFATEVDDDDPAARARLAPYRRAPATRAATAVRRRSPRSTTSDGRPAACVLLHLDGSGHAIPELGADVNLGDRVVGRVTSVARHYEAGPIALAVLKRSTDAEATLTVSTDREPVAAAQQVIVNADGVSRRPSPTPGPTAKGLLMGRGCDADGGDMTP